LGDENFDAGHSKCSRGPQAPHPLIYVIRDMYFDAAGDVGIRWFVAFEPRRDQHMSHVHQELARKALGGQEKVRAAFSVSSTSLNARSHF